MTLPRILAALGLLALVWFSGCQYAKTRQERALYQRSADSLVNTLTELRHREFIRDQQDKAREDSLVALALQNQRQAALIARQDTMNQILARSYADARAQALGDSTLPAVAREALSRADALIHGLEVLRDSLVSLTGTQALQIATLGNEVASLRQSRQDLQQSLDATVAMWHRAELLAKCQINLGLVVVGCPGWGAAALTAGALGLIVGVAL